MWELLNKLESKFIKQYTTIDLEEEIERIYNSYKLDTQIASKQIVERFKRYVEKNYNNLNDYGKYIAKKLLKRIKIQNNEIVEYLLYIIYNEKSKELDDYENLVVQELVEDTYTKEIEAIKKDIPEIKLPKPPLYVLYGMSLLSLPNANGYIWKEYKDATILYNSNEMYRHLLVNGNKDIRTLLQKQKNRYLKKKINPSKDDTYTGALEDELVYVVNQTKIKAYEDAGIQKVKFVAVHDNKVTPMCKSLDNQVFYTNRGKINIYKRYSSIADAIITYKTRGLEVGQNLPPIRRLLSSLQVNNYVLDRLTIL